jgi:hypothetical protein
MTKDKLVMPVRGSYVPVRKKAKKQIITYNNYNILCFVIAIGWLLNRDSTVKVKRIGEMVMREGPQRERGKCGRGLHERRDLERAPRREGGVGGGSTAR